MRIAVLSNAYPPRARGGAGRIAALQVAQLQVLGHDVRVWTDDLAWTSQPFWRRVLVHLRDLWSVYPKTHEIVAWQPEVLITHNLTGLGWRTPRVIQRRVKKALRWVHVLHDVQLFEPLGLLKDEKPISLLQRLVTCLRRPLLGRIDCVVSPTHWLLQAHKRRGWFQKTETVVIPNPAPAFVGSPSTSWHKPWRLLFVGRVSQDKGAEVLQELMRTAPRPIEWWVIGEGSEQLKVTTLPSGSALVTLPQSSSEVVLDKMRQADLLLVPSQICENQPTVLLEAFACGLPAVATTIGGIPETLHKAGVTLPVHASIDAWWQAIEAVFQKPRTSWSATAQTAWQRHDPERVVDAFVDALLRSNKKI